MEFLTEDANRVTVEKGKSKMVPDDIFKSLEKLGFETSVIDGFKAKMREFEETETVTLSEEERTKSTTETRRIGSAFKTTKRGTCKDRSEYGCKGGSKGCLDYSTCASTKDA